MKAMYPCGASLPEDVLSVFDPEGARRRMGVDRAGFGRVFEHIWREVSERRTLIDAAWQAGDFKRIGLQAHTIKSAAATIGAEGLCRAAAAVERAAEAGDRQALDAAMAALRTARETLCRLVGIQQR
ncbi:Hpt protein [Solidesulfovibrio fructosivorans JJ]]|uniref:Hpt protein n=1 Tax=Solidesulfovibrio fructosivorans JJ] TaxID=596151 RepID=E1JU48_SOLFR|nr:Hpt domain-containing protein [Solidesulfovibrio fructosivorans]EFL51978.1 Hpt protein [Solidesulfovibrio fructosivorans JJ]]